MGAISFKEFLTVNNKNKLSEYIKNYATSDDYLACSLGPEPPYCEINWGYTIEFLRQDEIDEVRVSFILIIQLYTEATGIYEGRPSFAKNRELTRIEGEVDLSKGNDGISFNSIKSTSSVEKGNLNDKLIKSVDFEAEAEVFLKRYIPEALESPKKIMLKNYIDKIGVKVEWRYCLNKNHKVLGACLFKDVSLDVYEQNNLKEKVTKDFKAGTLLIDQKDVSPEVLRFTVAHEISHWWLHRKHMLLASLCGADSSSIKCTKKLQDDPDKDSARRLEYQANMMAANILAPTKMFKLKVEELIAVRSKNGDIPFCDIIKDVIADVAAFFGISMQASKLRMIDCGYLEANEALIFLDNNYVRPVGFKKNSLEKHETFTLSSYDFLQLVGKNSELKKLVEDNKLMFVENHICICDPKFISFDSNKIELTDYARRNADECLIKLKFLASNTTYNLNDYSMLLRASDDDNLKVKNYVADPVLNNENIKLSDKMDHMKEYEDYTKNISSMIKGTFGESLISLMDYRDVTSDDLGKFAYTTNQTIGNYRNERTAIKPKMAYALVLGLRLPLDSAKRFLGFAGCGISDDVINPVRDILYSLLKYNIYSVDTFNTLIKDISKKFIICSKEKAKEKGYDDDEDDDEDNK